jgi:hypothetical protein
MCCWNNGFLRDQLSVTTSASTTVSSSSTMLSSQTSIPGTQHSPAGADTSSVKSGSSSSVPKSYIITWGVLGASCLCLTLIVILLLWRRRHRLQETRAAENPQIEGYSQSSVLRSESIQPFLATQTCQSTRSPKISGPLSALPSEGPLREQSRSRSNVVSWHTDRLPPSYSHRGEESGSRTAQD